MPGTKRPKNRKAQISLVAAELFCQRGYHGVGVDEIAAAVGITGPALYRHFPNKYAVLVHATQHLVEALGAVIGEALGDPAGEEPAHDASARPPQERLDRLLAGISRLGVDRRKMAGLYQWEGRYLTAEHQAEFNAELSGLIGRVADLVQELRPDVDRRTARLLTRGAFSVLSSPATHRAALNRARGEPLLQRAAREVLSATVAEVPIAPGGGRVAKAGGPTSKSPVAGDAPSQVPAPPIGVSSRREILMAAAVRLFHQQGFHSVGIEDIGRAAGITASSVYRYFPSKADLLAAVYYRAAERVTAGTAASLAASDNLRDALRRLVDGYVNLTFHQRDLVAVYQAENNNLPERDRHELRMVQRLQVEEWVRLVIGSRPELAPADARLLVHAALNLISDLGVSAQAPPDPSLETAIAGLALIVLRET